MVPVWPRDPAGSHDGGPSLRTGSASPVGTETYLRGARAILPSKRNAGVVSLAGTSRTEREALR